jgi:hypothetical protein
MSTCPNLDRLRELLADRLAAAEEEALEYHLRGCLTCQQRLER